MTLHPVTKDLVPLKDEDAIKRSIKNLLYTDNFERPFEANKGAGLIHLLFEPISKITRFQIQSEIEDTIRQYEPRAELMAVEVLADPENNGYEARITFGLVNKIDPITVDIFLERLR